MIDSMRPVTSPPYSLGRQLMNKVPEITLYFWIIKVLCTTVGETAADFLNTNLNMGLTNTTYVMGSLLLITLIFQFKVRRYIPAIYWLAVVLLSIVGTLITDEGISDGDAARFEAAGITVLIV